MMLIMHPPFVSETAKMIKMDPAPWPFAADIASVYLKKVSDDTNKEIIYADGYCQKY
jgi:hypothetical protein